MVIIYHVSSVEEAFNMDSGKLMFVGSWEGYWFVLYSGHRRKESRGLVNPDNFLFLFF